MGVNDREQDRKNASKNKAAEKRRFQPALRHGATPADWQTVKGETLAKAVAAVAKDGGALRLGYSRDGGAYAIGIYGDGDPYTVYVPPTDDIDEWLEDLIRAYED